MSSADYTKYQRDIIGANPYSKYNRHYEDIPSDNVGISDQYIVLDSFLKLRDSHVGHGEFRWDLVVQSTTKAEMIGIADKLTEIIEIEIHDFYMPIPPDVEYRCDSIPLPVPSGLGRLRLVSPRTDASWPALSADSYPGGAPFTPWVHNPLSQIPYSGRFTMQIKEVGRQSFSDINGNAHSFDLITSYPRSYKSAPNVLYVEPAMRTFVFTEPIRNIETLTVVFRNPDTPINFAPDVLYDTVIEKYAYGVGTAAVPAGTYLRFSFDNHGLANGDRIFITNAKTAYPELNLYLNRPDGHAVMGNIDGTASTDNYFFTDPIINLDDFAAIPTKLGHVNVNVAKRRIRIPMRIRRVLPHRTNFISL